MSRILLALMLLVCAQPVYAQVAISQLPAAAALGTADIFPIVQGSSTRKATLDQLTTFFEGTAGYTGSPNLVTVGTITTGVWNGTPIGILYGGTGATTAADARTNLGISGGTGLDNLFGFSGTTPTGIQMINRTGAGAYTIQNQAVSLGECNLLDYSPNYASLSIQDQNTALQNALLYCQRTAILNGATIFANLQRSACFTFKMPPVLAGGGILLTPIALPRYVCWEPNGMFTRDGNGNGTPGTITANWNGDTTTKALANLFTPAIVLPETAQLTGTLRIILNRINTDRGSGVFYGRQWRMASLALQAVGSGIPGSSIACTVRNGDTRAPSTGATFTLAVTAGAGTGITFAPTRYASSGGKYMLPPYQQRQQWAVNVDPVTGLGGFNGTTLSPQVFDNDTNKYYKTTCGGVDYGVTVSAKFWPDWCIGGSPADSDTVACAAETGGPNGTNPYDGIFDNAAAGTGYINQIYANQSANTTSADYGGTFGFWMAGFDIDVNFVQTEAAHWGIIYNGSDARVGTMNDVNSGYGLTWFDCASCNIENAVMDSSTIASMQINRVAGFNIAGNILNTQGAPSGAATILLGNDTASGAVDANHNSYDGVIDVTMANAGNSTPGIFCDYAGMVDVRLQVSNLGFNLSTPVAHPNTSFVQYGTHCNKSNTFSGSIDNVTGNIFSGTDPGLGVKIWDAVAQGYAVSGGMYEFALAGAPTSGGSGTGLNKAGPGSIYTNTTTGDVYYQTTASSSPTWVLTTTASNTQTLTSKSFNAGGGLGTIKAAGLLSGQYSAAGVGNAADTTDDVLFTYSLPASSLNANGQTIRVDCFGHTASNGNDKTVKLWFGSELISSAVVTSNNKNWSASLLIGRTGASTQRVTGNMIVDTAPIAVYNATGAETDTNAITIKCTGASPTTGAASDVLGYGMSVEFLN